jgi:hypothetical protein
MLRIFSNLLTIKVNPKWIIKDHLSTLVDNRGKRHRADFITFFFLPLGIAISVKSLGAELDNDMVDIINTGLSLFAGLFLTVSIQLISLDRSKLKTDAAKRVQKQTVYNISFLIFVALCTITVSYFSLFKGIKSKYVIFPFEWFKIAVDVFVYWLLGIFILTVLMVLKRTSILFDHVIND